MNITLEYSDGLIAAFTCTAFGGSGAEIEFIWSTEGPPNFLISSAETLNADNSTTSIGTIFRFINHEGGLYTCCVNYHDSDSDGNCETATINIGK